MSKKIIALAFSLGLAWMANASYLYWQTSTDTTFNGNEIYGYKIYVTDQLTSTGDPINGTALTPTYTDGTAVTPVGSTGSYAGDSEYKINIGDLYKDGTYRFYVEIIGYDSAVHAAGTSGAIGQSAELMTYSDLVSAGSIIPEGLTSIPTMWTGGTMTVPEPTSGFLMMVGLALLGLKRRKV